MKTINNFLPENVFLELKQKIINENFFWNFAFYSDALYNFYLNHSIFFNDQIQSPLFEEIATLLKNNSDLEINNFFMIRINGIVYQPNNVIFEPFIYHGIPHKVGILFLDTSDSGVVIYKDKYDTKFKLDANEFREKILLNTFDFLSKEESSENKMIIFDGYNYHSLCSPTNNKLSVSIHFTFN